VSVEPVARRQPDLDQGYGDYSIYAGAQLVSRIYQQAPSPEHWRWAINTVMIDAPLAPGGLDMLRPWKRLDGRCGRRSTAGFPGRWRYRNPMALAIPQSDLKYGPLDKTLKRLACGKPTRMGKPGQGLTPAPGCRPATGDQTLAGSLTVGAPALLRKRRSPAACRSETPCSPQSARSDDLCLKRLFAFRIAPTSVTVFARER
jgi:hypothetical protein